MGEKLHSLYRIGGDEAKRQIFKSLLSAVLLLANSQTQSAYSADDEDE